MKNKLIISLILTSVILILLITIMNGSIYVNRQGAFSTIPRDLLIIIISILLIAGLIVNGIIVRSLLILVEKEAEFNTQLAYYDNIEELFRSIKSQRHDFNNHVQTIYGMLKHGMADQAEKYISAIFMETKKLNEIINVDRPEVAALLKVKHSTAACRKINFTSNIQCRLSSLPIKAHELVRILGNIIDNAFDAAADIKEKKEVNLTIKQLDKNVFIEVTNAGNISNDELKSLFDPGVSKKKGHTGLGLYITKQIADKYNGEVKLESDGSLVKCILRLPIEN